MGTYQIFTDATADLSEQMMKGLPPVEIIPMQVELGGCEYTYGPNGNITVAEFYALQREGKFATTSQINPTVYFQAFEPCLRKEMDILYLCFSSGMSGTIQSARLCVEELKEHYPERRILCIDTLCASVGEGFLVREAARKQAEGYDLEALSDWVMENRLKVCHWFTVDIFDHLRHGGRVSAAAATMGTLLNIKPLLHVDEQGKLAVMEKPRGRRKAIASKMTRMKQGWIPELGSLVVIGHGDCLEEAELLRQEVLKRFPESEIYLAEIGPIIGAHTGPGMLAVIYWGDTR